MAIETVGIQTSLWNNNFKSILLLTLLPLVLSGLIWTIMMYVTDDYDDAMAGTLIGLLLVAIWFLIAFVFQEKLTMSMARAHEINRKTYPELYNLVENLSITAGIKMPKLYMMDSEALNAFASGISVNNAVICVTSGLVEKLNKNELEAVLAHEMSHITHRDMRLLTIATLFVGIIAIISQITLRSLLFRRSSSDKKGYPLLIVVLITSILGYFIAILSKFAISRKREFMADAGSVVLTKDKDAMIAALKKISGKSEVADAPSDLRFMLFDNTESYLGLFDTHPSIEKRIKALEKY
ncbi:M48 family metallopeptidase [Kamptonema cortianum]|jgi:heat shock protein HtpX|nr:M48 family metallopeptidase [Geitlerinema splendidum]MDK3161407.1 M48 family metallopeptidase [Kamptonema cortianum]